MSGSWLWRFSKGITPPSSCLSIPWFTPGYDHCWEIRDAVRSLQALLLQFSLAFIVCGFVQLIWKRSVIYHYSRRLVWKISTHVPDFLSDNTSSKSVETQGGFLELVSWESLTQGLNLLFHRHISTLTLTSGWTFSRDCLIYVFFLNSKGIRSSLFWQSLGFRSTAGSKREFDKHLTRPINPLFHIPRWDLPDWCLG